MSRLTPDESTVRLPAMKPASRQEETTLKLPAARSASGLVGLLNRRMLIKVPAITLLFWVIKLLTTALGESTSDYLVHHMNPVKAVLLGAAGFVVAMIAQLALRRYVAAIYWLAAIMVALFGTMCADVVHIVLGIPYLVSTIAFAVALAVIFAVWYATEHTLSIHSINTTRRELFYWATVITTFALGTATGDLTAYTFKLGFLASGILFLALFAIPAIGYALFRMNAIFAFWFAYILTRPIGASFADWTGKSRADGGIGLGNGHVSLVLALAIVALVGYYTVTRKDVQSE